MIISSLTAIYTQKSVYGYLGIFLGISWMAVCCDLSVAQPNPKTRSQKTSNEPLAPSFDAAQTWLNTDKPIQLEKLRGQVVVLDFWTYCCINCMHMLPVLSEVERAFMGKPLAVLGIHSAKFDGERDTKRIEDAIDRYQITHPVAVDSSMTLWKRYGVRAWPTLVFIRPNGQIADVRSGELNGSELKGMIDAIMQEARADGTLAKAPVLKPSHRSSHHTLLFPSKVVVQKNGNLVIADSGHHRLVVLNPQGKVVRLIGEGAEGFKDGNLQNAQFNHPQGVATSRDGSTLYVADTRNHAIRKVDLRANRVETLAGTGTLGRTPLGAAASRARHTALRSPWDVLLSDNEKTLYIALAGSHQIATLDLKTGFVRQLTGTGQEDLIDGAASSSALAQPSGLSLEKNVLWIADSETSSIRRINVKDGSVQTSLGTGLFDFGDRDGETSVALLQHPLHVLATPKGIFIADTYNHKIKVLTKNKVQSLSIKDLREPGGLAYSPNGELLIADTGNHRIVRVDLTTLKTTPLEIQTNPTQ